MSDVYGERVRETTTTTGTGTLTLAGAVAQHQAISTLGADGTTSIFMLEDANGTAWERFRGTIGGSGTTLARTTTLKSTNSNNAISLSSGTHRVYCSPPASGFSWAALHVTPEMYGAVGDGTTDDTAAIQAALNTGAHVVYAMRTYKTTATLILQSYQILCGPRRALIVNDPTVSTDSRIIFRPSGADQVCIRNSQTDRVEEGFGGYSSGVEDMGFDLDDDTHTVIQFNQSYGNVARRIWFYGTFNIGVIAHKTYVCTFEDLIFNGVACKSFYCYASADTNAMTYRRVHISALPPDAAVCQYGIAIDGGYAQTIADCVIQGPSIAVATGSGVKGLIIDNMYCENTLCCIRLGNSGAGPSGSAYVVRASLLGAPDASHNQYAKRGPVCYLMCGRAVFDGVSIQSTADNTTARGPWPFVLSDYCTDLQFNNVTHYNGTTRNLFYRETSSSSPHMTVIGGAHSGGKGSEIIMKSDDLYGTQCVGFSFSANNGGSGPPTMNMTNYQPAVIFAAVDALLKTALPVGSTLVL